MIEISFTVRMKRSSPVILQQPRASSSGMHYNEMNEEMMYAGGQTSNNDRNLTPVGRSRNDEGV